VFLSFEFIYLKIKNKGFFGLLGAYLETVQGIVIEEPIKQPFNRNVFTLFVRKR